MAELRLSIDGLLEFTFTADVLFHFDRHRQRRPQDKEAGGQLFAEISKDSWRIVRATGPRRTDIRSRFGFRPNRNAERAEIEALFASGLHYVGDWHTHPQPKPRPSQADIQSLSDMAHMSKHELPGFLMAIVGLEPWPNGLWVSLHTTNGSGLVTRVVEQFE